MLTQWGLRVLGLIHLANAAFMLAAPERWYASVPGVRMTGPINPHFVADIGLAFLASGAGLLLGSRKGPHAAPFAVAGATWPVLHALLHVSGWFQHGVPAQMDVAIAEIFGVMIIGALGAGLAWFRWQEETHNAQVRPALAG